MKQGKRWGSPRRAGKVETRNFLNAVAKAAQRRREAVVLAHKGDDDESLDGDSEIPMFGSNQAARQALDEGNAHVVGGTAWLWSHADLADAVDVLFVDEADEMALANVLAMSPSAGSIALLGDPQQLEQPRKAAHPDGVDVSALEHMLAGHATVPDDRGVFFLPRTWRMCPSITDFTSETFYESRLSSMDGLDSQIVAGVGDLEWGGVCGCCSPSMMEIGLIPTKKPRLSSIWSSALRPKELRGPASPARPNSSTGATSS